MRPTKAYQPQITITSPKVSRLDKLKNCTDLQQLFEQAQYETHINHQDFIMVLRFQKYSVTQDPENLKKLQNFCSTNFSDLPLFLLYEISKTFHFTTLQKKCILELVLQNFEQMNYNKLDLTKCSFDSFRDLLEEYRKLLINIQVPGLQKKDLIMIVDDYCKINNVSEKEKNKLYDNYVNCPLYELNISKTEMRSSMIETRPRKGSDVTNYKKQPNQGSPGLLSAKRIQSEEYAVSDTSSPYEPPKYYYLVAHLHESAVCLKQKNEELLNDLSNTIELSRQDSICKDIDNAVNRVMKKIESMEKCCDVDNAKLSKMDNLAQKMSIGKKSEVSGNRMFYLTPPAISTEYF